jgi:hypothetical protein
MGKRLAEEESFQGNISSMQREVTGLYATKGITSYENGTGKNSSESSARKQIAVYITGASYYERTGMGESRSYSHEYQSRSRWSDSVWSQGDLQELD